MSNIVNHSIFSDYTFSIGHSKIYSNYLFIYFCKKRKEKKKSANKLCKLQCVNSYYITFALFFLIHCQTFFPLYQYSYTKEKTISKKYTNNKKKKKRKKKETLYDIPKNQTKQRIKQNTSKLLYIYVCVYIYIFISIIFVGLVGPVVYIYMCILGPPPNPRT